MLPCPHACACTLFSLLTQPRLCFAGTVGPRQRLLLQVKSRRQPPSLMLRVLSRTPRFAAPRGGYWEPSAGSLCRFRGANQRACSLGDISSFRSRCIPLSPRSAYVHSSRETPIHPHLHPPSSTPLPRSQSLNCDLRLLKLGLRHSKMKTDLATLGGVLNRHVLSVGVKRLDKPVSEHLLWRSM